MSSSEHSGFYLFNHVSNAIVFCLFLFYMLERNLGRHARSLPSSCEYFPTESCSSLKACTSRWVLAANEVRSHFEGKVFTLVLRRYFMHISSPIMEASCIKVERLTLQFFHMNSLILLFSNLAILSSQTLFIMQFRPR